MKQHSIQFAQWIEVLEQTASLSEKLMWVSCECLQVAIGTFKGKWFSLKGQHLQTEATLHSLFTVNWSVGTDCFSFRLTHVSFWWMLVSSLRHFQRKVIFSERTAFRKWSNTPFTSQSELKCWNRLLLFQRNACDLLVNACKLLKAVSKESEYLCNYSI